MKTLRDRTAVITGAASGFGLDVARLAAAAGMRLVLADIERCALATATEELVAMGAQVQSHVVDVSNAAAVDALASATRGVFGAPHFVFNNAGVSAGGLVWENPAADWTWIFGVNVMGVAHGVRAFTPMMLEAAESDPNYEGHIINTASMAGLQSAPALGVYNASKFAVVGLTETLYQDLSLITDQIAVSVLCPAMVPTGIDNSERNRAPLGRVPPTNSQLVARQSSAQGMKAAQTSAADVAKMVFAALHSREFYIITHPKALDAVELRMQDIMQRRQPGDPFHRNPGVRDFLRQALKR